MVETGLSVKQRKRVEKDIINHAYSEETIGENKGMDEDEFHTFIAEHKSRLDEMTDDEVLSWWKGSVGEWLAPQNYDSDIELSKVINSGNPAYGYREIVYDMPY